MKELWDGVLSQARHDVDPKFVRAFGQLQTSLSFQSRYCHNIFAGGYNTGATVIWPKLGRGKLYQWSLL